MKNLQKLLNINYQEKSHFQIQFLPVIREDEVEYIQLIISDETVGFQYEDLIKKNVKEFEIEEKKFLMKIEVWKRKRIKR